MVRRACGSAMLVIEAIRLAHRDAAAGANRDDLQVLAYNLKRAIKILGAGPLMAAMKA